MEKYLGIYFHIPFCARRCSYCDFYSLSGRNNLMDDYCKALLAHVRESAPQLSGYYLDTVYFGGGTPSYFGADRLIELLNSLKENGNLMVAGEITAEVNPDSAKPAELAKLRKAGFNRLSIGIQSTNNEVLRKVGRLHSFEQARDAVANARAAGFENVSIDLIYGLPGQNRENWAEDLSRACALKPDHISCYGLKLSEGTELYILKDSPFLPDDDAQADMYLYTVDYLASQGFNQYEISNFARTGFESRHNLKYWTGQEYLGFGAAAHSYIGGCRFGNIADAEGYCQAMKDGGRLIDQHEKITPFEKAGEYLMLGLRLNRGICAEEYRSIYPADFSGIEERLETCRSYGWAVKQEGRWSFTPKGFLISNVLIGQILEAQVATPKAKPADWSPEKVAKHIDRAVVIGDEDDRSMFHGI